jgi:hypothetical protein
MFRAKCKANQELGNRRRVHTPMRRRSTPIVQPRRFDARAGGSERQFRNAVHYRGAGRTGRYPRWCGYCRSFFRLRRQCAAVNGETPRSCCRGKGQRIGFCVLAHRRTFLADVWNRGGGWRNRCARHERPYICMEEFVLTNLTQHQQAQRTAIVIGERHQTVPRMEAAGWQPWPISEATVAARYGGCPGSSCRRLQTTSGCANLTTHHTICFAGDRRGSISREPPASAHLGTTAGNWSESCSPACAARHCPDPRSWLASCRSCPARTPRTHRVR